LAGSRPGRHRKHISGNLRTPRVAGGEGIEPRPSLDSHAVGGGEDPAGLYEDTTTEMSEGLRGATAPHLQGYLPGVGPRQRLLPPEDPGGTAGVGPAALGELPAREVRRGGGDRNHIGPLGAVRLMDGRRSGWSWTFKENNTMTQKRCVFHECMCVCVCLSVCGVLVFLESCLSSV